MNTTQQRGNFRITPLRNWLLAATIPAIWLAAVLAAAQSVASAAITVGAKSLGGTPISIPISAAPSFAKYALVIGVSNYESCPQLPACTNDAKDFAALLKAKYGFDNVVLMTDDPTGDPRLRPTQQHIFKALKVMYSGIIKDKSEVVFFFSGHGARGRDTGGSDTDFLVPEDADPTNVGATCVSYDRLKSKLNTLQPRRILLITDACRDLLGNKGIGSSGFGQGLNAQPLGPEVAELQSCLPTETSLVGNPADFNESVFTHYLIAGLSGDPNAVDSDKHAVTFDSLKQYIQYSVHSYAAKLNSVQTPDGRATLGGMVLASIDNVETPQAQPAAPQPQVVPAAPLQVSSAPGIDPREPIQPVKTKVNPIDGATMVFVPAGDFIMGGGYVHSPPVPPAQKVYLSSYWIYKNDVTVTEYAAFCNATGRKMPGVPPWGWKGDHPIVNVAWDDAVAYAHWAQASLPTEAQWEKAARGTDGRTYPWGNDWDPNRLALSVSKVWNVGSTAPAGSFPSGASPFGALDMVGNVWQWCDNYYDATYYTPQPGDVNPGPVAGPFRAVRGQSWCNYDPKVFVTTNRTYCPSTEWFYTVNNYNCNDIGFRCAVKP